MDSYIHIWTVRETGEIFKPELGESFGVATSQEDAIYTYLQDKCSILSYVHTIIVDDNGFTKFTDIEIVIEYKEENARTAEGRRWDIDAARADERHKEGDV